MAHMSQSFGKNIPGALLEAAWLAIEESPIKDLLTQREKAALAKQTANIIGQGPDTYPCAVQNPSGDRVCGLILSNASQSGGVSFLTNANSERLFVLKV